MSFLDAFPQAYQDFLLSSSMEFTEAFGGKTASLVGPDGDVYLNEELLLSLIKAYSLSQSVGVEMKPEFIMEELLVFVTMGRRNLGLLDK